MNSIRPVFDQEGGICPECGKTFLVGIQKRISDLYFEAMKLEFRITCYPESDTHYIAILKS